MYVQLMEFIGIPNYVCHRLPDSKFSSEEVIFNLVTNEVIICFSLASNSLQGLCLLRLFYFTPFYVFYYVITEKLQGKEQLAVKNYKMISKHIRQNCVLFVPPPPKIPLMSLTSVRIITMTQEKTTLLIGELLIWSVPCCAVAVYDPK